MCVVFYFRTSTPGTADPACTERVARGRGRDVVRADVSGPVNARGNTKRHPTLLHRGYLNISSGMGVFISENKKKNSVLTQSLFFNYFSLRIDECIW